MTFTATQTIQEELQLCLISVNLQNSLYLLSWEFKKQKPKCSSLPQQREISGNWGSAGLASLHFKNYLPKHSRT